jgi:integral membrane sensor domain MASE1
MPAPTDMDRSARRWGGVALLALASGGAGQLLHATIPQDRLHLLFWPPAGIAVGALVRYGARLWPGVFLGICLAEVGGRLAPAAILALALAGTAGALVAVWGMQRDNGFRMDLSRRVDVGRFVSWTMGGAGISATLLVVALFLLGELVPGWGAARTASSWIGILVGTLVGAPLLLLPRRRTRPSPDQVLEYLLLSGTTLAVGSLIFSAAELHTVAFLGLMPLLWGRCAFPGWARRCRWPSWRRSRPRAPWPTGARSPPRPAGTSSSSWPPSSRRGRCSTWSWRRCSRSAGRARCGPSAG